MKNKLAIGDTVRSKNPKGQIQVSGTVVGLLNANFYVDSMLNNDGKRSPRVDPGVIWGKNYPNWREELVALVYFNFPQRVATKDEWVESGVAQGYSKEGLEDTYEQKCPVIHYTVFPINDLKVENVD